MYDVIVIGAGPAGSTAAKILSENGCNVLLAEKFKMPRYKSCSGILIKKTVDLIENYYNEPIPLSAMSAPTENKGMIFINDFGKESIFEQPGLNIWRTSFDHWLAQKASAAGAEIRDNTAVLDCTEQNNCVAVTLCKNNKIYTESTKYVLNCEGVVGAIKRKVTNLVPQFITTYQTFNQGCIDLDPQFFYAYLQPELSEYDAWFNVKDQLLILGVSVKNPQNISHYHKKFIDYMKNTHNLKIEKQIREEKWLMPEIYPGCQIDYGINRILFAGEAAGFLNPMGEGISAGIESGYCAGLAIAENFDDLERLYITYKNSTAKLKTYMERQWSFAAHLSSKFSNMK